MDKVIKNKELPEPTAEKNMRSYSASQYITLSMLDSDQCKVLEINAIFFFWILELIQGIKTKLKALSNISPASISIL